MMAPQLPLYQAGDPTNHTIFWRALDAGEVGTRVFPTEKSQRENKAFALHDGQAQMLNPARYEAVPGSEVFTYYIYEEGGRQHAVTDWAVEQFRDHYGDATICQSDILYYTYAVLHHPTYEAAGGAAASLSIPLAEAFWAFSDGGRALTAVRLYPGDDADVETARIAGGLPALS